MSLVRFRSWAPLVFIVFFYIHIIDVRGHPIKRTCRNSQVSPLAILLLKNNSLSAIFGSMKTIAYSKAAAKALRKMQPKRAAAIVAKVEAFANGEMVDLKKLQGSEFFRIRVWQDRVINDQTMQVLVIIRPAHAATSMTNRRPPWVKSRN
ncbi:hypothetical protein LJR245_000273 [Rhizobium leguminosarum]|uniref:type II toxin-antitoxin system RelE family toxin n=1 Tax=Rhizobium leguminosarum TaxID=384 RepID=UPI003ECC2EDD